MAADLPGYGYGLGLAGGAEATRQAIVSGGPLPFQLFLALGVVAGSAAAIRRPLRLPGIPRAGGAFAGGMLMGVGATTAKACNIGHGVTGLGLLSLTRGRGRHGRGGSSPTSAVLRRGEK